jgi:hypothetical protein
MRFLLYTVAGWLFSLAPAPAHAQTLPPIGTDASLDIATWNIEWFGSPSNGPTDDARQLENVRMVIEQSEIDLWAVEEIADAIISFFPTVIRNRGWSTASADSGRFWS